MAFKLETLNELGEYGIRDELAWDDWLAFSEIQHASRLVVDDESVARFRKWRTTHNSDDAWS